MASRYTINGIPIRTASTFNELYIKNYNTIRRYFLRQFNDDYGKAEDAAQDILIRIWEQLYEGQNEFSVKVWNKVELEKAYYAEQDTADIPTPMGIVDRSLTHLIKNIIWSYESNLWGKTGRRVKEVSTSQSEDESDNALSSVVNNMASSENVFTNVRLLKFLEDLRDTFNDETVARIYIMITLGNSTQEIINALSVPLSELYHTLSENNQTFQNILFTHFTRSELNIND